MHISSCIKLIFGVIIYFAVKSATQNIYRFSDSQTLNNMKVAWISFVKYTERYFNGTSFLKQMVASVAVCQRLCIINEPCKAFNLLPISNGLQCQLFNKSLYGSSCSLERHMTSIYYTISNPCTRIYNLCADHQECIPDEHMTSYSCKNKTGLQLPHFCPTNINISWFVHQAAIPTPFCQVCDANKVPGSFVILNMIRGENFQRNWQDYKHGFGGNSFYVGHELVYQLTTKYPCELHVYMSGPEGEYEFFYEKFSIDGEDRDYKVEINGFKVVSGEGLTDEFSYSHNNKFSAYDRGVKMEKAKKLGTALWYHLDLKCNFFSGFWRPITGTDTSRYFTNVVLKLKKKV
ncbi:uncharacterized protein LOC130649620 isoform X2 [Hydractinia symbiolongicarpus]|uniref:uncharacterized protein LOC130649620 isoform X2 n=1 Tax=Hydractinia symbiolongicarpus TaxID=13093 RepID=UPI00254B93E7|nr:uncharacterized protein LOC130649620 isoform X2 [Hydractinia symbiolongicarpus]